MIFFTKSNLQASLMVRNCRNTRHVTLSYECLDFGCHVLQYDLWLVPENFSPRTSVSPLPMLYTIRTSVSPLQKLSTIRNSVFPLQNSIPLERPFLLYNSSIPLELPFLLYKTLYHQNFRFSSTKLYHQKVRFSLTIALYHQNFRFSSTKLYTIRTSVYPLQQLYTIRTSVSPLQKLSTIRTNVSPLQMPYTIRNSVSPLQNSTPLELPFLLHKCSIPFVRGLPGAPSVTLKIPRGCCKGRENMRNLAANFDPPATVWFLLLLLLPYRITCEFIHFVST